MEPKVVILAFCMLVTGTINTIATKYQDISVVGKTASGKKEFFRHPAVQSAFMFGGEFLCLIPYALRQWQKRRERKSKGLEPSPGRAAHSWRSFFTFAIPASCDATATTLLNIGLFYTSASIYQMLRGTLVVFAGLMTIVLLKRSLHIHHWLGMAMITAGAALVGAASILPPDWWNPDKNPPDYHNSTIGAGTARRLAYFPSMESSLLTKFGNQDMMNPLLGDILVVVAQLAAASQFIVEEKYLAKYRVPALLAVGMEGFWGLVILAVALPVLSVVKGGDGLPLESASAAMREIAASRQLQISTVGSILSIAFFNFFGISVTKKLSGAGRAAIDACRTLLIWMFSLAIGWEKFLVLQVLGFALILCGSSLYNELLRSCLPQVHGPSPDGELEAEEPLLGASPDVDPEAYPPRSLPVASGATRPRSIRGNNNIYTMARSVLLFPTAISPHSLASPALNIRYEDSLQDLYGAAVPDSQDSTGYLSETPTRRSDLTSGRD